MTIDHLRISARELAIILGALITLAGLLLGRVGHSPTPAAAPIEAHQVRTDPARVTSTEPSR